MKKNEGEIYSGEYCYSWHCKAFAWKGSENCTLIFDFGGPILNLHPDISEESGLSLRVHSRLSFGHMRPFVEIEEFSIREALEKISSGDASLMDLDDGRWLMSVPPIDAEARRFSRTDGGLVLVEKLGLDYPQGYTDWYDECADPERLQDIIDYLSAHCCIQDTLVDGVWLALASYEKGTEDTRLTSWLCKFIGEEFNSWDLSLIIMLHLRELENPKSVLTSYESC